MSSITSDPPRDDAVLLHCVYFQFRTNVTDTQRRAFEQSLATIATSPNVLSASIGRPAPTGTRPIVVTDYDYALVVRFADLAAHDRYQSPHDAIHTTFVETNKPLWQSVRVFDVWTTP